MLSIPSCTLLFMFGIISLVSSYNPAHPNSRQLLMDSAAPPGAGVPTSVVFSANKYSSGKYSSGTFGRLLPEQMYWEPRKYVFNSETGVLHWGYKDADVSNALNKYIGTLVFTKDKTSITRGDGIHIQNGMELKGKSSTGSIRPDMWLKNIQIIHGCLFSEMDVDLVVEMMNTYNSGDTARLQTEQDRKENFKLCLQQAVEADAVRPRDITFVTDIEILNTGSDSSYETAVQCELNLVFSPNDLKLIINGSSLSMEDIVVFVDQDAVDQHYIQFKNYMGKTGRIHWNNIRDSNVPSAKVIQMIREWQLHHMRTC